MGLMAAFSAGGWAILAGWIFPSLIATAIASFFLIPALEGYAAVDVLLQQSLAERTSVIAGVAVALGLLLSAVSKPLYRVLEGYSLLPGGKRQQWILANTSKKKANWDGYEGAMKDGDLLKAGLLLGNCQTYPVDDNDVRPTRLANQIAAFETYGWNRYQLDVVTSWEGLVACGPAELRKTEERTRAGVDFFVSLIYLSLLLAILSTATALLSRSGYLIPGLVLAALSGLSTLLWYRLAVIAAGDWGGAVRAIIDLGRLPFAESLGFQVPHSLTAERDMWRKYNWLRKYPYDDERSADLEPYRLDPSTSGG
jgi:hypothetical protein